jgi:AbrB family looped-hinge helix DNA binding protein
MRTTIDNAGRVVIPKVLRERMGLTNGGEVEIRFRDGVVELAVPPSKGHLVQKGSVLVWDVPGTEQISAETVNRVIEEIREEREQGEDRSGY